MKKSGAHTIGQDEESSVVYGMPKKAFDYGAVIKQVSLGEIAMHLIAHLKQINVL
jgi:two-component system chemotaxis response regulator CheB